MTEQTKVESIMTTKNILYIWKSHIIRKTNEHMNNHLYEEATLEYLNKLGKS